MTLPLIKEPGGAFSGFLEGAGLGMQQAMPSIQEMIMNKQKQKQSQELLQKILPQMFGGQQNAQPDLSMGQQKMPMGEEEQQGFNIGPEHIAALSASGQGQLATALAPFAAQQQKEKAKLQAENRLKQKAHYGLQNVFSNMSNMLAKNLPGIGISADTTAGINRKGVENRTAFDSMRARIEAALLPMVNKGTLAKPRFDFIMEQIPKASDSQRSIAGKLRGLSSALSEEGFPIDTSILDRIPWVSKELKSAFQGEKAQNQNKDFVIMQDPEGHIRRIPRNKAIEAQRAGGKLVK